MRFAGVVVAVGLGAGMTTSALFEGQKRLGTPALRFTATRMGA
jgi:hypothetical protein